MRKGFIGLFWKFSIIVGSINLIVLCIILFFHTNSKNNEVEQRLEDRLKEVAGIISVTVNTKDVSKCIIRNSVNLPEYKNISEEIRNILQFYSHDVGTIPIYAISILSLENKRARVFYKSRNPFRFLENYSWDEGFSYLSESGKIFTKSRYLEDGQYLYSSFSPMKSLFSDTLYAAKVDITRTSISEKQVSFWKKLVVYLLPTLLLSFIISIFLSQMILKPIDKSVDFVNQVSEGNYSLRLNLQTRDELEKIGHALNIMLERLEGLIESEADRDRLQDQITGLLKIVSAAADGDFTVRAAVTADTLGALADSFNLMVAELAKIIRDVKRASDEIAASTQGILRDTQSMTQGAENQAKEIGSNYKAARDVAEIIKYANERTQLAAESARDASKVAQGGRDVVKKSIEGMHRIRNTVQETSRRVKLLGDSSSEIGEIIELISDIANRTNLLALNATIEAARAGDAGRGFAVVADEVRILAERSSQAAKDIAVLIEGIQAGTHETMIAMERGRVEVEAGTALVDEAGDALQEIMDMVQKSSRRITEISEAFQQQTRASSDIAEAMERIAKIAEETAAGAHKSRKLAEQMERLSKMLNSAVTKFKLA